MKNVVIYHDKCCDGFMSAYLFWKHKDSAATFIPMQYPCKELEGIDKSTHVWFLDFSASLEYTKKLCSQAAHVTVLDHHKTARDDMIAAVEEGIENLDVTFDMERSGCRIVWDYIHANPHPTSTLSTSPYRPGNPITPPWLVQYVEDRDLWRFKLQDSVEINAYIRACDFEFLAWDELMREDPALLVHPGAAILAAEAKKVKDIVDTSYLTEISGPNGTLYTVPGVNTQTYISEVLHELAKNYPFAVAWWTNGKIRKYSLRVDSETNFDGSIIARHHKGGGHPKACGWEECEK